MSTRPRSISVPSPNGGITRTAFSKRYYVVVNETIHARYNRSTGETVRLAEPVKSAHVCKRTDSISAAEAELRLRASTGHIVEARWDGEKVILTPLTAEVVAKRVGAEKRRVQVERRQANRSIWSY